MDYSRARKGFTAIELTLVVFIVGVLSVLVYAALNGPELFKRSRDTTRIADLKKLDSMVSLLKHDRPELFFGNASSVYVSLYDPSATSTAKTNCTGMGLPALSSGGVYQCAASSTYRKLDGTGWLPMNALSSTIGLPYQALPIDPRNITSTPLYYTYSYRNGDWEFTANLESSAYATGGAKDEETTDGGTDSNRYEFGSNLTTTP